MPDRTIVKYDQAVFLKKMHIQKKKKTQKYPYEED